MKYFLLLLLTACAQYGHPATLKYVNNYAREIESNQDFATLKEWVEVLAKEKITYTPIQPTYADIVRTNNSCNNKQYKLTHTWPTPSEFKAAPSADCKGFTICKYYALRKVGFKPEQLNIWAGDYNGHAHMMLVASLNDKQYVLDIGAEANLPEAKDYFYKHFKPAYRFNEIGWDVN